MPLVIRPCRPGDREALVEQFLALNRYEEPLARNRRTDRQGAEERPCTLMVVQNERWQGPPRPASKLELRPNVRGT